jgi:hypothetical protein
MSKNRCNMRTVALLNTFTRPMQFIGSINEFHTLTGLPKYRVISTSFICPQRMKSDIAIYIVYCSTSADPSGLAVYGVGQR